MNSLRIMLSIVTLWEALLLLVITGGFYWWTHDLLFCLTMGFSGLLIAKRLMNEE